MCAEPDWRAFGGCSKASARADLIQLMERMVWHNRKLQLSQHWAVCLARGADAVLAAVHLAGGAQTLTLASPELATCLCHSLMQAVGDLRRRWLPTGVRQRAEMAFVLLGPDTLRHTAEDLQEGIPICAQQAYAATRLAHVFVTRGTRPMVDGGVCIPARQDTAEYLAEASQVRRQVFACSKNSNLDWLKHALSLLHPVCQCTGLEPLRGCIYSERLGACCMSVLALGTFVTQLSAACEHACRALQSGALRCWLHLQMHFQLGQRPSAE